MVRWRAYQKAPSRVLGRWHPRTHGGDVDTLMARAPASTGEEFACEVTGEEFACEDTGYMAPREGQLHKTQEA